MNLYKFLHVTQNKENTLLEWHVQLSQHLQIKLETLFVLVFSFQIKVTSQFYIISKVQ